MPKLLYGGVGKILIEDETETPEYKAKYGSDEKYAGQAKDTFPIRRELRALEAEERRIAYEALPQPPEFEAESEKATEAISKAKALLDGINYGDGWAFKIWDHMTQMEKQKQLALNPTIRNDVTYYDRSAARALLIGISRWEDGWAFETWANSTPDQKKTYLKLSRTQEPTKAKEETELAYYDKETCKYAFSELPKLRAAAAQAVAEAKAAAKAAEAERARAAEAAERAAAKPAPAAAVKPAPVPVGTAADLPFKPTLAQQIAATRTRLAKAERGALRGGGSSRKPRYNTYRKKKRKITKRRRYKKTLRR